MPCLRLHVDLDEIYDDMDRSDKRQMAEWLYDDGFVVTSNTNISDRPSITDIEWVQMITKINDARYRLTAEQEKMLFDLAKSL